MALVDAVQQSKPDARILVACATNDGVDNIAELCVDKGLNVGRVGTADSISTQFKAKIAQRCYFATVEKDMENDHVGNSSWNKVRRERLRKLWDNTPIICATNGKAAEPPVVAAYSHHLVVLDESCMAIEPMSLIPVNQCRGDGGTAHFGDPQQLPPACNSVWAAKNGLNISLMESLQEVPGIELCLLDQQHRMHPKIRRWPSFYFYGNQLTDGPAARARKPIPNIGWPRASTIVFVNVNGCEQRGGGSEGSINNMDEAIALVSFLAVYLSSRASLKGTDIGIITPYSSQVAEILRLLEAKGIEEGILLGTVDKFQGAERELILMSTVRCNSNHDIGFLKEERRLNVSITRARRGIVIFGHARTLHFGNVDGAWTSFLERAAVQGFLLQARDRYWDKSSRLRLDQLENLAMSHVTAKGGQAMASAHTGTAQGTTQKWSAFLKSLWSVQRLEISEDELADLRKTLVDKSRSFMKGPVVELIALLMSLPEHRYGVDQRPDDVLEWDQKAISHQGELVRAGQPRDIGNFYLFNVLQVMKIGMGTIPASFSRMVKLRKNILQDKSPSSRLRCYEKGADIVEALCGLCAVNNALMSGAEKGRALKSMKMNIVKASITLWSLFGNRIKIEKMKN